MLQVCHRVTFGPGWVLLKVSCDWRTAGYMTTILTSDWSRATRTLPVASWAASLPPTWRSRC